MNLCSIIDFPIELIEKILINDGFCLDDYLEKFGIANRLNKNNFFQDSSHQVLAGLGIKKANLLFSCKKFYNYSKTNIKAEAPKEFESYVNFLIENQSTFNLSNKKKHHALNNFAFIFFNLDKQIIDKSVGPFTNETPQFNEPFVFALTFRQYQPDEYPITRYDQFFRNVTWFDKTVSHLPITIGKKLIIIKHLSKFHIKLYDKHKYTLEKFLETPALQDKFINILKNCKKNINIPRLMAFISHPYKSIQSAENIMKIINFIFQKHPNSEKVYYDDHCDEESNRFKNMLIVSDFSENYHDATCKECLKNKTQFIKLGSEQAFHDKNTFWFYIIQFLINQKNTCNYASFFNNEKVKTLIEDYHPHVDYANFLEIVSLLKKFPGATFKYEFNYLELFDRNKNRFKNLLYLNQKFTKEHHKEQIHAMSQGGILSKLLQETYTKYYFRKNLLKKLSCGCWECKKDKFHNSIFIKAVRSFIKITSLLTVLLILSLPILKAILEVD